MGEEKRPEKEAEELYEQTVKNLLNTPPAKKVKDGERKKQRPSNGKSEAGS